jgi:hypothetical protein
MRLCNLFMPGARLSRSNLRKRGLFVYPAASHNKKAPNQVQRAFEKSRRRAPKYIGKARRFGTGNDRLFAGCATRVIHPEAAISGEEVANRRGNKRRIEWPLGEQESDLCSAKWHIWFGSRLGTRLMAGAHVWAFGVRQPA